MPFDTPKFWGAIKAGNVTGIGLFGDDEVVVEYVVYVVLVLFTLFDTFYFPVAA